MSKGYRNQLTFNGQSWTNLSNKINVILGYNPKYIINIHESTLRKMNEK